MTKSVTSLDDKYTLREGRVFLSSIQALVRLPIDQSRRDRDAGLLTAGFISGYRGSPLGTYDAALWAASRHLEAAGVRFLPGLNEELAATSMRGTQELAWFGKSRVAGAFALWYGKGLGVDRACESLKLGNLEGTSALGGVLVVAGDDHSGKSSASAHQSEHTLIAGFIPILYPADPAEILSFGLAGWALSRYSGLWIGLKCVTDTLDLTASIELPRPDLEFVSPSGLQPPPSGFSLRQGLMPLQQEDAVVNYRLPAAQAFIRTNALDRTIVDSPHRKLSIIAAGKAYLDVRQALKDLGLAADDCARLGIRLYKPAMIWPLEPKHALNFIDGSEEILVVEEKRPIIEDQIARLLCSNAATRSMALSGKRDPQGAPLLPSTGELSPSLVRTAIASRMFSLGLVDTERAKLIEQLESMSSRAMSLKTGTLIRTAYYCSGCPHNTGTRIPEGSTAMSAVGCHGLAAYVMPERHTMYPMPMGGEGMPWLAASPLVDTPHMFQNMGDGTFAHSGILAIRAAVAAEANVTFKILYNDAVAMTGGQPVEGKLTPLAVVEQLLAEHVNPVVVVTDEKARYANVTLPPGVGLWHRDHLDRLQRKFREIKGVSAIIYDQTCAAELRRRRKRGLQPPGQKRVVINPAVCEGCGDCSAQANCVSIQPLETEVGRKRVIEQSTCNSDFSCLKGFCPSFITLHGATTSTQALANDARISDAISRLPAPPQVQPAEQSYNILIAGIGGTGVLTVGAIVGMAAHLEGKHCSVMDMTGMAQKGGAVTSHLRIASSSEQIFSSRLDVGMCDLLLACDLIVATSSDVLKTLVPQFSRVLFNEDVTPTGEFQRHPDLDLGSKKLETILATALSGARMEGFAATQLASRVTGDSIATNMLLLGYAAQRGLLPVSIDSLEEAIRLNNVSVESNLRTLALGRVAAHEPQALAVFHSRAGGPIDVGITIEQLIARQMAMLVDYQDRRYAQTYAAFVRSVEARISRCEPRTGERLVREIAITLARLMAYKDEYEVARLHSDPEFWSTIHTSFRNISRVDFHLAPPLLARRDFATGRPRKITLGPWILQAFRILKKLKFLRGTRFDPFGYTSERRMERKLIEEFRSTVEAMIDKLTPERMAIAIELACAPREIRGFGPVKAAATAKYRKRRAQLMSDFQRLAAAESSAPSGVTDASKKLA
jgi:indolepyruvate ferredoxin oxidoreductase